MTQPKLDEIKIGTTIFYRPPDADSEIERRYGTVAEMNKRVAVTESGDEVPWDNIVEVDE